MKCSIGCRKIVSQFYQKCVALQTSFLLHGFHHLVHSDRTVFECCFWWLMICAGFWGGILTASVFVKRHIESPTVVSIERDYTTWNTTFPSFTLCSKRKMNESALQNYLNEYRNPHFNRNRTEQFLRMLVQLTMNNLETFFDFAGINASDYLSIVDDLAKKVNYDVIVDAPNKLRMERTITESGICYTFNSHLTPYLTPTFFTKNQLPPKAPIFQINYLDAKSFAMINGLESSDVYFHGPYDLPAAIPLIDIGVNSTQYAGFVFSALSTLADAKLRQLFIVQRKCRYIDESNLRNFPWIYSFDLCKIQCKINMMTKYCGCVPFFYMKRDDQIYCESFACIRYYNKIIERTCDRVICERNCVDVMFNMKKLNQMAWFRGNSFRIDLDKPKLRVKREVIYSFTDVLIATGATLGLFLGVGVLSFTKIVYLVAKRIFAFLTCLFRYISINK